MNAQKKQKLNSYAMNAVGLVVRTGSYAMRQLVVRVWENRERNIAVQLWAPKGDTASQKQ